MKEQDNVDYVETRLKEEFYLASAVYLASYPISRGKLWNGHYFMLEQVYDAYNDDVSIYHSLYLFHRTSNEFRIGVGSLYFSKHSYYADTDAVESLRLLEQFILDGMRYYAISDSVSESSDSGRTLICVSLDDCFHVIHLILNYASLSLEQKLENFLNANRAEFGLTIDDVKLNPVKFANQKYPRIITDLTLSTQIFYTKQYAQTII